MSIVTITNFIIIIIGYHYIGKNVESKRMDARYEGMNVERPEEQELNHTTTE